VYGLVDALPRAAFTISTPLNSAYKTMLVRYVRDSILVVSVSYLVVELEYLTSLVTSRSLCSSVSK